MAPGEFVVVSAFGLSAAVALPIVLHFRSERRKRELEHIERMRALEVGRAFPGELKNTLLNFPQWAIPHLMALAIGLLVPLGVFVCACLATLFVGFHKELWISSGMVGLGAVICGTVLAGSGIAMTKSTEPDQTGPYANSKPYIEDDAYDVVSARG
jgi:hypothetical protein